MFARKRRMILISAVVASGLSVPQPMPAADGPTLNANPIAAGAWHSLAVASDGTVWGWGAGFAWSVMGAGKTVDPKTPSQATGLGDVVAVAGGYDYSLALKGDGTLQRFDDQCPGRGFTGVVAVATGINEFLALKGDGTVWQGSCQMRQVSGLSGVAAIAGGWNEDWSTDDYFLALKTDGTVWEWGTGSALRQVSGLAGVVGVAAGRRYAGGPLSTVTHALAVKSDGTVWAWGRNGSGQLGDGTLTWRVVPVQVGGLAGVVGVAAGGEHSLALKSDGTVWAWGWNGSGQLGDGTLAGRVVPVQVSGLAGIVGVAAGGEHSLALKSDGTLWTWGRNEWAELGDGTTTDRLTPVQVKGLPPILTTLGAASCRHSVSTTGLGVAAAGGTLALSIQTGSDCPWSLSGLPDWLTVSGSSQGIGPAIVNLVADANAGGSRTGLVSVGSVSVPIRQVDAAACGGAASCVVRSLPHLAFGGEWTTGLSAVSSGTGAGSYSISFYGDNGASVALPFAGGLGNLSTLSDSVPAQGLKYYEAENPSAPVQAGWGLVTTDASVTVQAIFRRHTQGGAFYEAAVPSSAAYSSFVVPFDATTFAPAGVPMFLGLAINNFNPSAAANIICTARDELGEIIPNAVLIPPLSPLGHYSDFKYPALTGKRGTLTCTADTLVSAIALRFLGYDGFSTLPVIVK